MMWVKLSNVLINLDKVIMMELDERKNDYGITFYFENGGEFTLRGDVHNEEFVAVWRKLHLLSGFVNDLRKLNKR